MEEFTTKHKRNRWAKANQSAIVEEEIVLAFDPELNKVIIHLANLKRALAFFTEGDYRDDIQSLLIESLSGEIKHIEETMVKVKDAMNV